MDTQKAQNSEIPAKRLKSSIENAFDWKMNCFLCGKKAVRQYSTVARVETLPLLNTLINCCQEKGDEWGS